MPKFNIYKVNRISKDALVSKFDSVSHSENISNFNFGFLYFNKSRFY